MCLVLFAISEPDAESCQGFVLAANRDEFHARESRLMDFRSDRPAVLAGRDALHGGTWLGVGRSGAVAFVTNVRLPERDAAPRSRGELPFAALAALEASTSGAPAEALAVLAATAEQTRPYNLVLLSERGAAFASNRPGGESGFHHEPIGAGVHGLSNGGLNDAWPKIERGRAGLARRLGIRPGPLDEARSSEMLSGESPTFGASAFEREALERPFEELSAELFELLGDARPAPDAALPDTGVGLELERFLAPLLVVGEGYGTRCSTVVRRSTSGRVEVAELTRGRDGAALGSARRFAWSFDSDGDRDRDTREAGT